MTSSSPLHLSISQQQAWHSYGQKNQTSKSLFMRFELPDCGMLVAAQVQNFRKASRRRRSGLQIYKANAIDSMSSAIVPSNSLIRMDVGHVLQGLATFRPEGRVEHVLIECFFGCNRLRTVSSEDVQTTVPRICTLREVTDRKPGLSRPVTQCADGHKLH